MLFLIRKKPDEKILKEAALDLDGYIKFVVDLERKIMTIGGARHYEGEQKLLQDGSSQEDLWGGGFDLETKEMDFDSMINIRPNQGNSSREVLSSEIRSKIEGIINKFLK